MSIAWLSKCWPLETGKPSRKAVLLVLADHADEDGFCWPRVRTIADRAELAQSTVRQVLGELEDAGLVEIKDDYEPAGRQTSNVYKLNILQSPPINAGGGRVQNLEGAPPESGGSTRTVSRTVSRNRENGSGKPRRMNNRPDDDSEPADESPSLGSGRTRETRSARKEREESTGTTTFGLVLRLKRKLEQAGYSAPVNERGLTNAINSWKLPHATVEKMLELFASNPRSYLRGNEVPWTGLIRQREVLKADAGKMVEAEDPTAKFRAG